MRDVAVEAGVSIATVSRVLSGTRQVRPELAEAVRQASSRLGYRTNHVARALRRRVTHSIGMIVPAIANPFFPGVVEAVEHRLVEQDLALLLCDSQEDPALERLRVDALLDRQVDGMLIVPCDERASLAAIREAARAVPVVQVDRLVLDTPTDHVAADHAQGMRAVLAHLRDRGRRSTVLVSAQPSISAARERLEAYRDAAADPRGELLGEFSIEWGAAAAARLLTWRALPDAVVCGNDLIALGLLRKLQAAGVAVPEAVAVTGFDDIGFATVCDPPLTTVHQPVDEIGAAAARLLGERVAGYDGPARAERVTPSLVVRASSGRQP